MRTKVWNLMYVVGNTGRLVGDGDNPHSKRTALEGAATVSKNGWRCWIEHHVSGKRAYENRLEAEHRTSVEERRVIKFAEDNVPRFARERG